MRISSAEAGFLAAALVLTLSSPAISTDQQHGLQYLIMEKEVYSDLLTAVQHDVDKIEQRIEELDNPNKREGLLSEMKLVKAKAKECIVQIENELTPDCRDFAFSTHLGLAALESKLYDTPTFLQP